MKRSLALACVGFMLMAGSALAADVTFALQAPAGGKVTFSKVPVNGLPNPGVDVERMTEIDGVAYYTWKTSMQGFAVVCGVNSSNPQAVSKCAGAFGQQFSHNGNVVVLK